MSDSVFAFTDLPIKILLMIGNLALFAAIILTTTVIVGKFTKHIPVPGYSATIITILFFAALNSLGLGIIGSYAWRTYENTKARPNAIIRNFFSNWAEKEE